MHLQHGRHLPEAQGDGKQEQVTVFRMGDVFVRHGTSSERWTNDDRDRLFKQVMARLKDTWRRELTTEWAEQVNLSLTVQNLQALPTDAVTWQLDAETFDRLATEFLRRGDDIPLRHLLNRAPRDAGELLAAEQYDDLLSTTVDDRRDLAVPLLVDLGTGLGDRAVSTRRQQMVLFEKLSRASMRGLLPNTGKVRLHPFVGFDPLRQLRAGPPPRSRRPADPTDSEVCRALMADDPREPRQLLTWAATCSDRLRRASGCCTATTVDDAHRDSGRAAP